MSYVIRQREGERRPETGRVGFHCRGFPPRLAKAYPTCLSTAGATIANIGPSDAYPNIPCEVAGCSDHAVARRQFDLLADHPELPDPAGPGRSAFLCYEHFAELATKGKAENAHDTPTDGA